MAFVQSEHFLVESLFVAVVLFLDLVHFGFQLTHLLHLDQRLSRERKQQELYYDGQKYDGQCPGTENFKKPIEQCQHGSADKFQNAKVEGIGQIEVFPHVLQFRQVLRADIPTKFVVV